MIKETFTDKLIKRFYGITGPLDEQKRQQVDRMGNIAFVVLFFTLLCGNCIAFLIGFKYPELVARIYPILLLKSGLCFGISMFLGMPLVHFLVDNKDYLTELFSIRNMLSGIFEAIFFGAIMQGLVNAGIKQAKSQAEKDDQ